MKISLVSVLVLPCAFAVRCYNYADSNYDLNPKKEWVECNDSQYCFKNYVEQRSTNETLIDKKWMATRSCGSSSVCKTEGCTGTKDGWVCCCRGDLCNATSSPKVLLLTIFFAFYIVFAL